MKVSKITSEFSKGYWNIYLSGYDEDGKNVKKVLKGTSYSAYGKNSVFERLLKRNTFIKFFY